MDSDSPFAQRLDALARRVLGGPASALAQLTGGASMEIWSFDAGGAGYVLRRTPDAGHFAGLEAASLVTEAAVITAAGAAGVPVPRVAHVLAPGDGLGSGFVSSREPGEALGRRVVASPALAPIRPVLARRCGEALAAIHRVPVAALPPLATRGPRESVEHCARQLAGFGEPRPVFEAALVWLARYCPDAVEPRLAHGDFRTGNFLVTPERLSAVLDWEGTHLGDPVEDLGWLTMPVWRFGRLDLPVGGFGTRDDLYRGYAAAGGEPVDPDRVHWWEVYGMLRWGLTCMAMAEAFMSGDRTVERAAVGRRASEAELELLVALAPERG